MESYKFYTPKELAVKLLDIIPESEVSSIIDICCGSWNLLNAACDKYPYASITAVDIDPSAEKDTIQGASFYIEDGRDFAIKQNKQNITYDLILSNPPFGYLHNDNRKYKNLTFEGYSSLCNSRYENEMIISNLLLMHQNSFALIILPCTFVIGDSMMNSRIEISKQFRIHSIIKLPSNTFSKGQINTYAIILQKCVNNKNNSTDLYVANFKNEWCIEKVGTLNYSNIVNGVWEREHECKDNDVNITVKRGKISSNDLKKSGDLVYHCSVKKEGAWMPSKRYIELKKTPKNKLIFANKGDILINRIGKGAGYWTVNLLDNIPITDCIIVIKNTTPSIIKILNNMSSCDGRLPILIRGLTTPYITEKDVINLLKT